MVADRDYLIATGEKSARVIFTKWQQETSRRAGQPPARTEAGRFTSTAERFSSTSRTRCRRTQHGPGQRGETQTAREAHARSQRRTMMHWAYCGQQEGSICPAPPVGPAPCPQPDGGAGQIEPCWTELLVGSRLPRPMDFRFAPPTASPLSMSPLPLSQALFYSGQLTATSAVSAHPGPDDAFFAPGTHPGPLLGSALVALLFATWPRCGRYDVSGWAADDCALASPAGLRGSSATTTHCADPQAGQHRRPSA